MTKKKKKKKVAGAGVKRTMEVDLKWLEENPDLASDVAPQAAPIATKGRNTIDVDPAWLDEDAPNVDIAMPPRDSEVPKRVVVPPALPPLELLARPRAKMPALPREETDSEPPPAARRSSKAPARSSAPPAPRRSSKRPPST